MLSWKLLPSTAGLHGYQAIIESMEKQMILECMCMYIQLCSKVCEPGSILINTLLSALHQQYRTCSTCIFNKNF